MFNHHFRPFSTGLLLSILPTKAQVWSHTAVASVRARVATDALLPERVPGLAAEAAKTLVRSGVADLTIETHIEKPWNHIYGGFLK
jgi:hypothetical protein